MTVDTHTACWRGADLLQVTLAALGRIGYHKIAIDTWRHDPTHHSIRHSYAGGEWTLACWYDGQIVQGISWPNHTSALRAQRLLRAVLPPALMNADWHLGGPGPVD